MKRVFLMSLLLVLLTFTAQAQKEEVVLLYKGKVGSVFQKLSYVSETKQVTILEVSNIKEPNVVMGKFILDCDPRALEKARTLADHVDEYTPCQ